MGFQHTGPPQRQPPMRCWPGGHAPRRTVACIGLNGNWLSMLRVAAAFCFLITAVARTLLVAGLRAVYLRIKQSRCFWAAVSLLDLPIRQ